MDEVVLGAFIDNSSGGEYSNHRILGVRLRRFSLWHRLLLNAVDSPFMCAGPVTMRSLRIAVGICRLQPFDSQVRKPWLVPCLIFLKALGASLWRPKRFRAVSGQAKPLNALQRALTKPRDAFLAYCGDYLQAPEYIIIPPPSKGQAFSEGPRGKLPDAIEHAGELIHWGMSEFQAWSLPLGRANTYRIIARRDAGNDVDVTTDEEKEFRKTVPPEFKIVGSKS